ncbi:MAG: 1-acyl-sn-glycerol-3-phosphate acyltransferase [Planctomycetes bacterium]|nr:1-acyl-sn-glycerol-3-phosphate acyltransferase [Planctomycetota bacterium]
MAPQPANGPDDRRAAPPGWRSNALFWPFWVVVGGLLRLWFRLRVVGPPPPPGGCVLAANHTSFVDPIVLGAAVRRRVVFLMTEVVYRSRSLGWFFRWNHAIPVALRGGNREALRTARAVLQQGRVVGVFPEGGLSRDGRLLLGSPGAVSLVLNENVPIVPVGITGAGAAFPPGSRWPRPRRITVAFGEPILPAQLDALGGGDRRARLQAATRLIMDRIAALSGQVSREAELAGLAAPPAGAPAPPR